MTTASGTTYEYSNTFTVYYCTEEDFKKQTEGVDRQLDIYSKLVQDGLNQNNRPCPLPVFNDLSDVDIPNTRAWKKGRCLCSPHYTRQSEEYPVRLQFIGYSCNTEQQRQIEYTLEKLTNEMFAEVQNQLDWEQHRKCY